MNKHYRSQLRSTLFQTLYIGKRGKIALAILCLCLVSGGVFDWLNNTSLNDRLDIKHFQEEVYRQERKSLLNLKKMKQHVASTQINFASLMSDLHSAKSYISYYIFKNDSLIFWSSNKLDVREEQLPLIKQSRYMSFLNAECIVHWEHEKGYDLVSVIPIKHKYSLESKLLKNDFYPNFSSYNGVVKIINNAVGDRNAIFSEDGSYLFTLSENLPLRSNRVWADLSFVSFFIFFIIFFFCYANFPLFISRSKTISLKLYLFISLLSGIALLFCLRFNIPKGVFNSRLFSSELYASGNFLSSLSHLSILSFYLIASANLFFRYVRIFRRKRTLFQEVCLQTLFVAYFCITYYLFHSIIFHSTLPISIVALPESYYSIWIHFLLLTWVLGGMLLHVKIYGKMKQKAKAVNSELQAIVINFCFSVILYVAAPALSINFGLLFSLSYFMLWTFLFLGIKYLGNQTVILRTSFYMFVYTLIIVINLYIYEREKREIQYKTFIENTSIYQAIENTGFVETLFKAIDHEIKQDENILALLKESKQKELETYLNETYFNGFKNNYNIKICATSAGCRTSKDYDELISKIGQRLDSTNFYVLPPISVDLLYIGRFTIPEPSRYKSLNLYIEFLVEKRFSSYSIANLLIDKETTTSALRNVETAVYIDNELVGWSGKNRYPNNTGWITQNAKKWYSFDYQNKTHYVYRTEENIIYIITELRDYSFRKYMTYWLYIFFIYVSLCWMFLWVFPISSNKKRWYRLSLSSKFQYVSFSLFIISFICIFFISSNFLRKHYESIEIRNIENKRSYIQKSLQDIYYWNTELEDNISKSLNASLQDLSYTFQTDIHIYDNRGILIASSQPIIFTQRLTSDRISPLPFFEKLKESTLYESIGNLRFLSSYSRFYNGDYLPIAYISIHRYYNEDQMTSEIENFLRFIVEIYIIIILISMALWLFLGQQLSAPLNLLEKELKEMSIGRKSKKISYKYNDEIRRLVDQYNQTVDKLEKSAALLAKSERESAWKTMARQVAHEINNPLTPMKLSIQQLQRSKKYNKERFDEYFDKATKILIEQIDSLSYIATSFSAFSRQPIEVQLRRIDIAYKLYSAFQLLFANEREMEAVYIGEQSGIFIEGNPEELLQVFNNLFKNAKQSLIDQEHKKITVSIEKKIKNVIIKVSDTGIGISPEVAAKLFTPNFTTKSSGMGLGLAISKKIVENSKGKIAFRNNEDEGTTFILSFPLYKD